jgi:hypothetical protein
LNQTSKSTGGGHITSTMAAIITNKLLKKPCFGKMTLNFIGKFAWNFGQNEFFSSLLIS